MKRILLNDFPGAFDEPVELGPGDLALLNGPGFIDGTPVFNGGIFTNTLCSVVSRLNKPVVKIDVLTTSQYFMQKNGVEYEIRVKRVDRSTTINLRNLEVSSVFKRGRINRKFKKTLPPVLSQILSVGIDANKPCNCGRPN